MEPNNSNTKRHPRLVYFDEAGNATEIMKNLLRSEEFAYFRRRIKGVKQALTTRIIDKLRQPQNPKMPHQSGGV